MVNCCELRWAALGTQSRMMGFVSPLLALLIPQMYREGNLLIREGLPSRSHDKARPESMFSMSNLNSKTTCKESKSVHESSLKVDMKLKFLFFDIKYRENWKENR